MPQCIYCAAEWHDECEEPVEESDTLLCCCSLLSITGEGIRALREGTTLKDVISTGRKRAAAMYPLVDGAPCEWQHLKFAGGGVEPIIGCLNGKQTDRHHGPDKSVLNNVQRNVHLICSFCHNRWHSKNDTHYGERPPNGEPFIPLGDKVMLEHDYNTQATNQEMLDNEIKWTANKGQNNE